LADFENYTGDINLEYGGLFVDLSTFSDGYAEVLQVTDLDSGCGFDGAVMVERLTALFGRGFSKQVKAALRTYGDFFPAGVTGKARKSWIVESCVAYGLYDPVEDYTGPHRWVIQCDPDGPKSFDGWTADIVLDEDQDLFGYLLDKGFLSEFE
jgi:hypothetical protein